MNLSEFYQRAEAIPSNSASRLHPKTYEIIQRNNFVVDCHCHLFPRTTLSLDYILLRLPDLIKGVLKDEEGEKDFDKVVKTVCKFVKNAGWLFKLFGLEGEDLNAIRNYCDRTNGGQSVGIESLEQEISKKEFEQKFWEIVDAIPLPAEEELELIPLEGTSREEKRKKLKILKLIKTIRLFLQILDFRSVDQVYEYYADRFLLGEEKELQHLFETLVVVPMMDIESSPGWKEAMVELKFEEAIDEYLVSSRKYPLLPFFAVHPHRENLLEQFLKAFVPQKDEKGVPQSTFFGLKVYPALGYHPADHRLMPIYKVCAEKGIPVMTHCGGTMVNSLQEELDTFPYDPTRSDPASGKFEKKTVHFSGKAGNIPSKYAGEPILALADKLNAPELWRPVLEAFPTLRLNLAHFGGASHWETLFDQSNNNNRVHKVIELMRDFEGVYADFSYNIVEEDKKINNNFFDTIVANSLVRNRSLYGTDFWVAMPLGDLGREQREFISKFETYFATLAIHNPIKFLGLDQAFQAELA